MDKLTGILHSPNPVTALEKAMTSKTERVFKGTFDKPGEMEEIQRAENKMSTVTPSGSSGVIGRGILATAGSMISNSAPIKLLGAVTATFTPELSARLLTTKWGRGVIQQHLLGKPMDNVTAGRVAILMRGDSADDGNIQEGIANLLKSKKTSIEDKMKAAMIGAQQGGMAGLNQ